MNSSHSDRNPRDLESKNVPQVGRDFAAMNNRNVLVLNMTSRDEALLTTDAVVFFCMQILAKVTITTKDFIHDTLKISVGFTLKPFIC